MLLSIGLTSVLTAPHTADEQISAKPSYNEVVLKKELKGYTYVIYYEKLSYSKLIKQFDENKKREDAKLRERLRQQQIEREHQRIAEEKRQRELAQQKAQRLAEIRAEEERKVRLQAPVREREQKSTTQQPSTSSIKEALNIEFSYYTAYCNGCSGVTATGINVRNTVYYQGMRIIATDPRIIPTWSIVQFELDNSIVKAIALDTGGYIKGHKIDMLVESTSEAYKRGRHIKRVEIIRYGK